MSARDKVRYGALAGILLVVLFFIFSNLEVIKVNIIIAKIEMRQAFVIIGSFLAGVGVMALWSFLRPKFKGSGDPDAWKKG